jgi:hypothetical protein
VRQLFQSLPDWRPADTLPEGELIDIAADGELIPNTMRGMGHGPVNPHQVLSMVGEDPHDHDEFHVTRITNRQGKTSDGN